MKKEARRICITHAAGAGTARPRANKPPQHVGTSRSHPFHACALLEALCMACGMCCNGVLFGDVKLQRGDAASQLRLLGLPLVKKRGHKSRVARFAFPQPCAAYDGCRCAIHANRPRYCREFDCALLKQVHAGQIKSAKASQIIREARKRVAVVRHLLCVLGDTDEELPLKRRFERTTRRLLKAGMRGEAVETYGKLTLAMQNLNLMLSEVFYPGTANP